MGESLSRIGSCHCFMLFLAKSLPGTWLPSGLCIISLVEQPLLGTRRYYGIAIGVVQPSVSLRFIWCFSFRHSVLESCFIDLASFIPGRYVVGQLRYPCFIRFFRYESVLLSQIRWTTVLLLSRWWKIWLVVGLLQRRKRAASCGGQNYASDNGC